MVSQSPSVSKQRSERRVAVRLPLTVSGRDRRGMIFEEQTSSENVCRNGAAFMTRFDVALGSDLEIHIPYYSCSARRTDTDFSTQGRVVHVRDSEPQGERVIGVRFIGPRFQRMFRAESAV